MAKEKMFLLILLCYGSFAVKHSLNYFITGSSGVLNIPEFVGVLMVDGVQMGYCDVSKKILEPRQEWAKNILKKHPEQLDWYKHKCFEDQPNFFRELISSLKQQFNQSEGVHILQRIDGCEWDETTGEVIGMTQYHYNGEDFLKFDLEKGKWIALKPEADVTKLKWDTDQPGIKHKENDLTKICPEYLKLYVEYEKSFPQTKVLPSVSLIQKNPSSPVSCHATGFYPDRAEMFWKKDGDKLHEGVAIGEILPNNDGTFQLSICLNISSLTPEDWRRYECVFQLSDVENSTTLNKTEIRTNWGKTTNGNDESKRKSGESHFDTPIPIIVAVGAVVMLIAAVGLVVYKKKAARPERGICCWRRAPEPEQCALESATSYKLCLIVPK
ncbi:major histocompatibility complex class I-related protein 1 isoform X2 [Maylandia zebra]|uniref:major histocompatibility complex class I-related protein 1 isoform X2 n=1 Tax=Maylandia zebra TaxID=106582 RepID=UPI000C247757